jgi:hypothetical protein
VDGNWLICATELIEALLAKLAVLPFWVGFEA